MKPKLPSIVDKADIAVANLVSDGGYLDAEQSNTFIQLVHDAPTILKQFRTVRMGSPQMKINKIGFYDRILKNAPSSGTALAAKDRAMATTSQISLSTNEVIAEVHLPYDLLEDNIEKGSLDGTIMSMIAQRSAVDMEERVILSDTTDATLAPELTLFDGIIKQITAADPTNRFSAGNVVDWSAETSSALATTCYKNAIKAMPTKYFRQPVDWRFWTSFNNEIDTRDLVAARTTAAGDKYLLQEAPISMYGVRLEPNAWVPDTKIMLCHPMNMIFGIQRQIMIETDKDIRAREIIIVLTMRIAFKIEEPEACVIVSGIGE